MATTKINVLSPYIIYWSKANLTQVDISIFIYDGTQTTSRPPTATYSMTATAYNEEVTFDIADLIADYFDYTFDGDYSSQTMWVDYQLTEWISNSEQTAEPMVQLSALYGYGYFEDGVNYISTSPLLQSNSCLYVLSGEEPVIPVDALSASSVSFSNGTDYIYSYAVSTPTESADVIDYSTPTYINRVLQDGGTLEAESCVEGLYDSGATKAHVTGSDGSTTEVDIIYVSECMYTPYKVTFINRQGALQDVWFFKRSNEKLDINERKGYKRGLISSGSYSINKHQHKNFRINGKNSIELNTGFYKEAYNDVFEELNLSEDVWIKYENKTLPINIVSNSFKYKTALNDKLIQYKMEFEFAFDKISNIR